MAYLIAVYSACVRRVLPPEQVEGCIADLSNARAYFQKRGVCNEHHSMSMVQVGRWQSPVSQRAHPRSSAHAHTCVLKPQCWVLTPVHLYNCMRMHAEAFS